MTMVDSSSSDSIEAKFARRLAGNEKKTRDRAVKKLRQFLNLRSMRSDGGFSRDEMLRVWKGLFYCMWMSDKPLVQEELAKTLSNLMIGLPNTKTVMLFFETFFATMQREWKGIDRLRMDKFYLLVRHVLCKGFEFLKSQEWETGCVDWLIAILKNGPINCHGPITGLHYHMSDIYLEELSKVGHDTLTSEKVMKLLDPYCILFAKSRNSDLVNAVRENIFQELVETSDVALDVLKKEEEEFAKAGDHSQRPNIDSSTALKLDYQAIADRLFELVSQDDVVARNRKRVYATVKQFRELEEGRLPVDNLPDLEDSDEDEMQKSEDKLVQKIMSQRSQQMHKKLKRERGKKRKREMLETVPNHEEEISELKTTDKEEDFEDDITLSDEVQEISNEEKSANEIRPKKKTKKRKNKKLENGVEESVIMGSSLPKLQSESEDSQAEVNSTVLELTSTKTSKKNSSEESFTQLDKTVPKRKSKKQKRKKLENVNQESISEPEKEQNDVNNNLSEVQTDKLVKNDSKKKIKKIKKKLADDIIRPNNIPDILLDVADSEHARLTSTEPKHKSKTTEGRKLLNEWLDTAKEPNEKTEVQKSEIEEMDKRPKKANKAGKTTKRKSNVKEDELVINLSENKPKRKKRSANMENGNKDAGKFAQIQSMKSLPTMSTFLKTAASKVERSIKNKHLAAVKQDKPDAVAMHSPKRVSFEMSKVQVQPFRKNDKSIAVSPSPANIAFDPRKKPDFGLLKTRKKTPQSQKKRNNAADFF